ncbi:MAG TPA: hypothetical protein VI685_17575 [Candidatus Angelobacter sp.]
MLYTATGELEKHLARHGLAREHEINEREHAEMVATLKLSPSHALESPSPFRFRGSQA